MIVVDTNVLVYATGVENALRAPARALLDRVRSGLLEARTLDLVYAEFLHVYARRRPREVAVTAVRAFGELLGPPLLLDEHDRSIALDLFAAHPTLHATDAYLAAVSLRPDVDELVTADRRLAEIPGIAVRRLVPAT